ncbi:MAG: outer membrane beta-barrel protein [Alphaproteobacteria bacterium]|nr:outer membrane beta-barrel protein [Alphaproteobacteria bacterium]
MNFSKHFSLVHLFLFILILFGLQISPRFASADEGFYVGLNGGMNWISNATKGSVVAGRDRNGRVHDIEGDNGLLLTGAAGYRFSNLVRMDVSYSRLNNELDWNGAFPTFGDSAFTSDASSDVFLLNGYLHAKGLDKERFYTVDPFIGAGIGFTSNRLTNIIERVAATGALGSNVHDGTTLRPAARLGVGVDTKLSPSLTLTSSLDAYWLDGFETADSRNIAAGAFQNIGAWKIDDVVSVGITIGLRYSF